MSEIVKSNSNLTIKNTKIIRYDPKTEKVVETKPILLLDISGSMNHLVGKVRKIDMLREAVSKNTGIRQFCFSDDIWEVSEIPEPKENTDLAYAFDYLKKKEIINKDSRLTLISDGVPDTPEYAMEIALQLGIPINTLYIGRKNDSGERFMQMLARMTGGSVITTDIDDVIGFQKKLTNGISKLLYG